VDSATSAGGEAVYGAEYKNYTLHDKNVSSGPENRKKDKTKSRVKPC
jgi:hypothetical protein